MTLTGTYSLLAVGAAAGLIGAGAYRLVAPWLLGPRWFRRLTTGLGSAALAGGMLVHSEGVDFRLLKPTWLTIGLFVLLPGLFGIAIGLVVDAVRASSSWTLLGRRTWLLPVVALACFAMLVPLLAVEVVVAAILLQPARLPQVRSICSMRSYRVAVRALWLAVATLGLGGLVGDLDALTWAMKRRLRRGKNLVFVVAFPQSRSVPSDGAGTVRGTRPRRSMRRVIDGTRRRRPGLPFSNRLTPPGRCVGRPRARSGRDRSGTARPDRFVG